LARERVDEVVHGAIRSAGGFAFTPSGASSARFRNECTVDGAAHGGGECARIGPFSRHNACGRSGKTFAESVDPEHAVGIAREFDRAPVFERRCDRSERVFERPGS
jgi:hypothetical protein